jgi:hypothetical protein
VGTGTVFGISNYSDRIFLFDCNTVDNAGSG